MARRKSTRGRQTQTRGGSQAGKSHSPKSQNKSSDSRTDETIAAVDERGGALVAGLDTHDAPSKRMHTRQDAGPERTLALQQLMDAFREGDFDAELDDVASDNGSEDEGLSKDVPETEGVRFTRAKRAMMTRQRAENRKQSTRNGRKRVERDSDYVQTEEDEEKDEETGSRTSEALVDSNDDTDQDEDSSNETTDRADSRKRAGKMQKADEKRLILKFKMAGLSSPRGSSRNVRDEERAKDAPRLDDLDWSEFDLETINAILARREEIRKKRRRSSMKRHGADTTEHVTTAKLKRSSLAPPPLQLEKTRYDKEVVETDVVVASEQIQDQENFQEYELQPQQVQDIDQERYEADKGNSEPMDMDIDGDRPEYHYLFNDPIEAVPLSPGGSSLQLPPRTSAMNMEDMDIDAEGNALGSGIRHGRPHPAFIRSIADSHLGTPRDMRIVLQYELKSEERLLKDIRAEIVDKLSKLQTEEKLLRMIVKKDIDIEDDEAAMQNTGDLSVGFSGYIDNDATGGSAHAQLPISTTQPMGDHHIGFEFGIGVDAVANGGADEEGAGSSGSDSDDSLSGMSSSSSEDDVPDDEVTRGALNRVIMQYLPGESMNGNNSS